MKNQLELPSGSVWHSYRKSPFLIGKPSINVPFSSIFRSCVSLPEGNMDSILVEKLFEHIQSTSWEQHTNICHNIAPSFVAVQKKQHHGSQMGNHTIMCIYIYIYIYIYTYIYTYMDWPSKQSFFNGKSLFLMGKSTKFLPTNPSPTCSVLKAVGGEERQAVITFTKRHEGI